MRVVFDTNIFISAFLAPDGGAERAFRLAREKRFALATSIPILTETANKLREKFDQTDEDVQLALKIITRTAEVVRPKRTVSVVADEPDNRVLECALESSADVLVTGDRHLLVLKRFEEIAIVRLADFLRMFPAGPPAPRHARTKKRRG